MAPIRATLAFLLLFGLTTEVEAVGKLITVADGVSIAPFSWVDLPAVRVADFDRFTVLGDSFGQADTVFRFASEPGSFGSSGSPRSPISECFIDFGGTSQCTQSGNGALVSAIDVGGPYLLMRAICTSVQPCSVTIKLWSVK